MDRGSSCGFDMKSHVENHVLPLGLGPVGSIQPENREEANALCRVATVLCPANL